MPRSPTGAAEPEPGDHRRLAPAEVLVHRLRLCADLASLMVDDLAVAPPEVRDCLIMGLDVMTEAKERVEARR